MRTLVKGWSLIVTVVIWSLLWSLWSCLSPVMLCPSQTCGPRGQERSAASSYSFTGEGPRERSETCSLGFPVQLHRFLSEYLLRTQHSTQHSGSRGGSGGEGPAVPAPKWCTAPSTELVSRITQAPVILPNAITQPTTHKRVNIWNGKICKDSMAEVTFKISPEVTNRSGNRVLQIKRIEEAVVGKHKACFQEQGIHFN